MLLFVAVPDRSTARKICPASPPGLIGAPNHTLPPRLTAAIRSNVGVTPPFCALLERTHQNWLPKFPPPTQRLPSVSTSSGHHTGERGTLSGFIQLVQPSGDALNSPPPRGAAGVTIGYSRPGL